MGKSPAKWIKTVLFGKKSSKSNVPKGREKVANLKEAVGVSKATDTNLVLDPPASVHMTPSTNDGNQGKFEAENKTSGNIIQDGDVSLRKKQEIDTEGSAEPDAIHDHERMRQDQAATKAQAAFRGYLARRAFRALKGIIRLQALIRAHLVRRQAVATVCCMYGIVKLQALVRGRRVRQSCFGSEKHVRYNPAGSLFNPVGVNTCTKISKMTENAFIHKLLASSPTVMAVHLQYDPWELNSVQSWLGRWSASHFWKSIPKPKKITDHKSHRKHSSIPTVEAQMDKGKRGSRKPSTVNTDSTSQQTTTEFEKPKRNLRKVSNQAVEPVDENPQSELEKVKRNLRKVHNPVVENNSQLEAEPDPPKMSVEKAFITSAEFLEKVHNSCEKFKSESTPLPNVPGAEIAHKPVVREEANLTNIEQPLTESAGKDKNIYVKKAFDEPKHMQESSYKSENTPVNEELNNKEDSPINENQKPTRKSSILTKQECTENGVQNSPTLPSYMAATESAKAKLRLQGSPRSGQTAVEKNNPTRRHSLPSSTNNKISSHSPRTQRPVQAGSKGANITDRSVLSSREGNGKVTQVEWRR